MSGPEESIASDSPGRGVFRPGTGSQGASRARRDRRGAWHVAVPMGHPRDGLLAEVPAKLEAAVREYRRVDDGDAAVVGGSPDLIRDGRDDAEALAGPAGLQSLPELALDLQVHPNALLAKPGPDGRAGRQPQ